MRDYHSEPPFDQIRYYTDRGWPLFPLHSIMFGECSCHQRSSCKNPGKHPRNRNGCDGATTDWEVITSWLSTWWPFMNLGIATGGSTDLLVLDVDPRHGSDQTLAALKAQYGPLPRTFKVRTGSGGIHLYFTAYGVSPRIPNSAGKLGLGLDIRAEGGYVVAPPSQTLAGSYSIERAGKVAPCPTWMVELLQSPKVIPSRSGASFPSGRTTHQSGHLVALGFDDAVMQMMAAQEGTRNATLNAIAFWAGRRIARGLLDRNEVITRLTIAAELTDLDTEEIQRTLLSGLSAGLEEG